MDIGVQIDTRNLEAGIAAGRKFSHRSLAQTVNSAMYYVAVDAQSRTPFVTPATIDAELSAIVAPVIGRTGKALKGKKAYLTGKTAYTGVRKSSQGKEVPLAALIINKMAKEGKSLGKGFTLSRSPFAGVPRALGAQKMKAFVDRLIKNRRRSTHFLQAGYRDAIDTLKSIVRGNVTGNNSIGGKGLGFVVPAVAGVEVYGRMENDVGEGGEHAAEHNEALFIHSAPALQQAVDSEGYTRIARALQATEKDLADRIKPHWG